MAPSSTTTLSREPMKLILLGRFRGVGTLQTLINTYSEFYIARVHRSKSFSLTFLSCELYHVLS